MASGRVATLLIMRDTDTRRFMIVAAGAQLANLLLAAGFVAFTSWRPSDSWITLTGLGLALYLAALAIYRRL